MTKSSLLRLLCLMLFAGGAWAQRVQNMDIYFLAGPSFARTQVIGGSDVTLYHSTGYGTDVGYAYQVMRKSAASLWVEVLPFVFASPAAQTATIPGSISLGDLMFVPAVRLMVPVQSRISVFGAVGGGYGFFNNATLTSDNPPDLKTNNVTHGVFSVGGGVDFRLFQSISIRVDVRDYVTGRNLGGVAGRNHVMPMLGLAFHF
jgi:opacity protein-like surface antigen